MEIDRKWIEIKLPDTSTYEFAGADVMAFPFGDAQCLLRIVSLKNNDGSGMGIKDVRNYINKKLISSSTLLESDLWNGTEMECLTNEGGVKIIWGLTHKDLMVIVSLIGEVTDDQLVTCREIVLKGIKVKGGEGSGEERK